MPRLAAFWFWFLKRSGLGAVLYCLMDEHLKQALPTTPPRPVPKSTSELTAWERLTAIEQRFESHADSLRTPDGCLWTKVGSTYVPQQ